MSIYPIANLSTTAEKAIFGHAWCGPDKFIADKHVLIAKFGNQSEEGHGVEVYCLPSNSGCHTFKINVLDTINFRGEETKGYKFSLGSGDVMAQLAFQMSKAMSESFLGLIVADSYSGTALECFDDHTLKCKLDAEKE